MLLAERADEINVAPRDAAFAERNRLGEKIELGIGRSQSIDTLARNHCGERVAGAFGPQRKVTRRHRVEMRIEHERRISTRCRRVTLRCGPNAPATLSPQ